MQDGGGLKRVPSERQVIQPPKEAPSKPGFLGAMLGWLVGKGTEAAPRVERTYSLPSTSLSERSVSTEAELETSEIHANEAEELEEADMLHGKLTKEQVRAKEQFREMLLGKQDQPGKISPGTPLYAALQNDDNGILDKAFRINYVKVKENERLQLRSIADAPSFDDVVVKANKEKLSLILDTLEKAGLDKDTLESFKQNPQLLLTEATIDHPGKKDLKSMIQKLSRENAAFKSAFNDFQEAGKNYYQEKLQGTLLLDDEYRAWSTTYDFCEALQKTIEDSSIDSGGSLEFEEVEDLMKEFNQLFKENQDEAQLQKKFGDKQRLAMREVAKEILKNDPKFQEASAVVNRKKETGGASFDVVKAYGEDPEFREAYILVSDKYASVGILMDAEQLCKYGVDTEQLEIAEVFRGIQYVGRKTQVLAEAAVIGLALTVSPPVGAGLVALKMAKVAAPAVIKAVQEAFDTQDKVAALKDKKIRQGFFEKIFMRAPTPQERQASLKKLKDDGLLFQEDVTQDPDLKKYLESQGIKIENLPSSAKQRKIRKQLLETLKKPFTSIEKRRECLEKLHEAEILYKEDLAEYFSENEIKEIFEGEDITFEYEHLSSVTELNALRTTELRILKCGANLTQEERLAELVKLHELGLFFQEDFGKLETLKELDIEFKAYLRDKGVDIEKDLPSLETHYRRTKESLRQKHNEIREPLLAIIGSKESTSEQKLFALKQMHLKNACFTEDLELIERDTQKKFLAFLKKTPEKRKATFMSKKDAKQIIAEHERILKSKESTLEQKMNSLSVLTLEGLKTPKELKKLMGVDAALIRFNSELMVDITWMSPKLVSREGFYERGYRDMFTKLAEVLKTTATQHSGKAAVGVGVGVSALIGAGIAPIAAAGLVATVAGGVGRGEGAVEVVAGVMQDVNATLIGIASFAGGTIKEFTDIDITPIQNRFVKQLPSENQIQEAANVVINKGVGAMKGAVVGGTTGIWLSSTFGIAPTYLPAAGVAAGGFFGACATDGRVNQIPKGGILHAVKFTATGALVGASVPTVVGTIVLGLSTAGLIAGGVALTVSTLGFGLIIPLMICGAYAGYRYAGLVGKDTKKAKADTVMDRLEHYESFDMEVT